MWNGQKNKRAIVCRWSVSTDCTILHFKNSLNHHLSMTGAPFVPYHVNICCLLLALSHLVRNVLLESILNQQTLICIYFANFLQQILHFCDLPLFYLIVLWKYLRLRPACFLSIVSMTINSYFSVSLMSDNHKVQGLCAQTKPKQDITFRIKWLLQAKVIMLFPWSSFQAMWALTCSLLAFSSLSPPLRKWFLGFFIHFRKKHFW